MFTNLIEILQQALLAIGPSGVLLLAFVQEVFPPIPSTAVTVSAGFFFLAGHEFGWSGLVDLFMYVGLPVAMGLSVGSLIIYGLVYWQGRPFLERFGKYLGLSWEDVEKMQRHMEGHEVDDVIMFLARAFPLVPSVAINVFAGLVRWPTLSFFLHTFFGTVIRAMWSGFIGWQFGNVYMHYATTVENIQNGVLVGVVVIVAGVLFYRKRKGRTPGQTK